jgi:hypothetical protein
MPVRYRAGLSFGVFGADLSFISSEDALMERRSVSASIERRMSERWTLSLAAGAGLSGLLIMTGGERHEIEPGWLVAATSSWRLLNGQGTFPFFALLSFTLAGSGASTVRVYAPQRTRYSGIEPRASLYAVDARLGLLVGKTFWDVLSPYAGVRVFGGPMFWTFQGKDIIGGDPRHIQLAVGLSSSLPSGVDLFAEIAPFGERAATVGGGVSF